MCPAKGIFKIGCAGARANSWLVVPNRISRLSLFVKGFVDYIPGENLIAEVVHDTSDVIV